MSDSGNSSSPCLSREEQLALWKAQKKKGDKKVPNVRAAGISGTPPTVEPSTVDARKRPSPSVRLSISSSKASSSRPPTARRALQPSPSTPSFLLDTSASRRRRQSRQAPPKSNSSRHHLSPLQSHPVNVPSHPRNVSSRPRKSKNVPSRPTPVPDRIMLRPPRSTSPLSCNSSWYIHDDDDDQLCEIVATTNPHSREVPQAETPDYSRVDRDTKVDQTLDNSPGGIFSLEEVPMSQQQQQADTPEVQLSGKEGEHETKVIHSNPVKQKHENDVVCKDGGDERPEEAPNRYMHDDDDDQLGEIVVTTNPHSRDVPQAETRDYSRVDRDTKVDQTLDSSPGGIFSPEEVPMSQKQQQADTREVQFSGKEDEDESNVLPSNPVMQNHENDLVCTSKDGDDERQEEALNISISEDLPMLESALEEFQRPEEDFEWLYDEKSPPGRRLPRRRIDASQLLLPIPSLREDFNDNKSPPVETATTTPVYSEEEKFDWRDELSPILVKSSRRRVNEPLLLPIPSFREQIESSTPSTSTPPASTPQENLMSSSTRETALPSVAPNPLDTSPEEETVEVSPAGATKGKPLPTRFRQPPRIDNKTLLPYIAEDVDVDLSRLESLQDQVDRLLTERQSLANQMSAMRRSHEDRLIPFRDVFEELRVQRAKNARLEEERKHVMQTVATLQTQVKATVQMAVDRATQLEKELAASNRRNAELEAELSRLPSTQH